MPYTKSKTVDTSLSWSAPGWVDTRRSWSLAGGWVVYESVRTAPSKSFCTNKLYSYRQWNVNPNYKTLLATNGILPSLEYTLTEWSQVYSPRVNQTWKKLNQAEWWDINTHYRVMVRPSGVTGSGWPSNAEYTDLMTSAKNKTLAKARDMKVNMPVMFGEGRKTIHMLTDTARRLGNAYLSFLRRRPKDAARYLGISEPSKGLASHWLAYQYGWRPLLSDAAGLTELIGEYVDEKQQRPPRFTVTASAQFLRKLSYSGGSGSDIGSTTVDYKGEVHCKAKAGLTLEVIWRESALAAQMGLGATDLVLTAWELVPFSFVFDWFIGVGQYLESASALQGLRVLDGYVRRNTSTRALRGDTRILSNSSHFLEAGQFNQIRGHERTYYRSRWLGTQPELLIRGLDGLFTSATRLTSAAALFRQLTSGDRTKGAYRP